jgi:hypothetical protein
MAKKRKKNPLVKIEFDEMAYTEGYARAEQAALSADERDGEMLAASVQPNGLVTEDFVHLLVSGERSHDAIVNGAVFYNPKLDDVFVIEQRDDGKVTVTKGNLDAATRHATDDERALLLMEAVAYTANAYENSVEWVSSWTLDLVREAVRLLLEDGMTNIDWTVLLPGNPEAVWDFLGAKWLSQPWGSGIDPIEVGDWT